MNCSVDILFFVEDFTCCGINWLIFSDVVFLIDCKFSGSKGSIGAFKNISYGKNNTRNVKIKQENVKDRKENFQLDKIKKLPLN